MRGRRERQTFTRSATLSIGDSGEYELAIWVPGFKDLRRDVLRLEEKCFGAMRP